MRCIYLASSSLSAATAAGVAVGLGVSGIFPPLLGVALGVACGCAAAALTRLRDGAVEQEIERELDPPLKPTKLVAGTSYRELTREPDPSLAPTAEPKSLNWFFNDDFVIPERPLSEHDFQEDDAVEFTIAEFERGDVVYRGTVTGLFANDRVKVTCAVENDIPLVVSVPRAALIYTGGA